MQKIQVLVKKQNPSNAENYHFSNAFASLHMLKEISCQHP